MVKNRQLRTKEGQPSTAEVSYCAKIVNDSPKKVGQKARKVSKDRQITKLRRKSGVRKDVSPQQHTPCLNTLPCERKVAVI